jgi:hypothetical protein
MSTTDNARTVIGRVVGNLEHVNAQLSRAQHGQDGATVEHARKVLKGAADDLLVLRARLGTSENSHMAEVGR